MAHSSTGYQGLNLVRLGNGGYKADYGEGLCDNDVDCPFLRFGGADNFSKLAFAVHHRMQEHPKLRHYFPPTIDMEPIVLKNVTFMCGFFGGPHYKGPGLRESHAFLHITDDEFDAFADIFRQTISEMHIRDQSAVEDVLEAVEVWRLSVVDQSIPKKTRRDSKEKQRKASGDGKHRVAKAAAAAPNARQASSSPQRRPRSSSNEPRRCLPVGGRTAEPPPEAVLPSIPSSSHSKTLDLMNDLLDSH